MGFPSTDPILLGRKDMGKDTEGTTASQSSERPLETREVAGSTPARSTTGHRVPAVATQKE